MRRITNLTITVTVMDLENPRLSIYIFFSPPIIPQTESLSMASETRNKAPHKHNPFAQKEVLTPACVQDCHSETI